MIPKYRITYRKRLSPFGTARWVTAWQSKEITIYQSVFQNSLLWKIDGLNFEVDTVRMTRDNEEFASVFWDHQETRWRLFDGREFVVSLKWSGCESKVNLRNLPQRRLVAFWRVSLASPCTYIATIKNPSLDLFSFVTGLIAISDLEL